MGVLNSIVSETLRKLESRKRDRAYLREISRRLDRAGKTLALSRTSGGNSIIAEVKFASPSGGLISRETVEDVVKDYASGGAAALSILTEEKYFNGRVGFLEEAKKAASLPVLRKDFILDEFQLKEARAFSADGVLLIARLLDSRLAGMIESARLLGLWCLVEVHDEAELELALDAGAGIIGINNRELDSLEVKLGTTTSLCKLIPKTKQLVTESGINKPDDIKKLKKECKRKPNYYLIGTALMKAKNRRQTLRSLINA